MKRRRFLASLGAAATLSAARRVDGRDDRLDVRVWFSEAADRDGLRERVRGYVDRALKPAGRETRVDFGGTVDVSTEDAYDLVAGGEWPAKLASGIGTGAVTPVDDVNLLVTDGDMTTAPTGGGFRHVAAVGGASLLSDLPPVEETPSTVAHSDATRSMQVLLHEVGHALGLGHDYGFVREDGAGVVVSPMVSAYAWAPQQVKARSFDYQSSACGVPYPHAGERGRLHLAFGPCAADAIAEFEGNFVANLA